jgi:hypothetical protein
MDNTDIYRTKLIDVARKVQKAYLDIRHNLHSNTMSKAQQAAITSLPLDSQTGAAENRLRKFPNDCCMDASIVLANILRAIADGSGIQYQQFKHIRCRPTEKTKTVMFDFHQWLLVDGFDIDITFSQLKTVQKGNEGEIVFNQHPLIGSDNYVYEAADAQIEDPFVEFANFIIEKYLMER